jgi:Transcriptional regulatory protein, C terminal
MGTSLGGQQALCAAGLNPQVTAVLALVPAGADANGVAHGRQVGWPWLGRSDPRELKTGQLMSRVWPNAVVEDTNLRVNICALRRVLGDDGLESRYIVHVARQGYVFVAPLEDVHHPDARREFLAGVQGRRCRKPEAALGFGDGPPNAECSQSLDTLGAQLPEFCA